MPSADTTLSSAYCAGNHLLTSITPTVYQNGTGHALPGVTFGYSGGRPNKYDDSSQSYHMENNWQYLTSYHDHSTGVGASSITYHTAYNNSHGTPYTSGDNRYDPLYCVWNPSNCQSGTSFYPMDDKMWTEQVVTQITYAGKDSSASSLAPATISYNYWLTKTQGSCPADSMNDSDCVGFGWIPNSGLDWQDYYHGEFRGFGTVLITSPSGDLTVQDYAATWGWDSPASDPRNYLAGQMLEEDAYVGGQVNGANLLNKTVYSYGGQNGTSAACASTSTYPSTMYRPCEVVLLSQRTTTYEQTGSSNSNAPWIESDYTYDDYSSSSGLGDYHQSPATGSYHNVQQEVITGSNIPTLTKHWTYYTSNSSSSIYYYYQAHTVAHSDIVDSQGHMWACQDITYDQGVGSGVPQPAAGWPTTVVSYSDCSHQSSTAIKTYHGYDNYGDLVASVDGVAAANPSLYSSAGCTLSTAPTIFPTSSWSSSHYTVCHKYDPVSSLTTDTWNVLGQHTSTAYDATQGQLPISSADVNGQVTTMSYSYDSSGNQTVQVKLPNESGSYTSQSTRTSNCSDSSTYPCLEIDTNSSLYSGAVTKTFYDSQGRAVETLAPGPDGSHTIVTFTVYYDQTHAVFTSLPFVINSRTTWLDPNGATDDTGATPGGTSKTLDPLGRTISTTDALSYQTHISYSLGSATGDSQTYATTTGVDANNHVQVSFSDALGRTRYVQTYSGVNGGTLTPNMQISTQYNALNEPYSVVVTDLAPQSGQTITSVTTTMGYDDMGRMTSLNDPDRGLHTYGYDADGHALTDVSGSRTLGVSYDLLGRPRCLQDANPTTDGSGSCSSGSHPLVQNIYDTSKLGTSGTTDFPVGQLTQSVATTYYDSTYTNKSTVTEQFQHDQRGELIAKTLQIAVPSGWGLTTSLPLYQETATYNDAGQPTMLQTTVGGVTGYTIGEVYDATTGTLTGLNNTGSGNANLATLAYNPQDQISDINFQTTSGTPLADDHFTYDPDLRPQGSTASWQSGSGSSGTLFSTSRTYDPVGNVISVSTTQAAVSGQTGSGGSETQNFCYDEQNRLVWAGNSGTQPAAGNGTCGSGTLSNSLSGATYSSSFVYTHLGQLWQEPLNSGSTQEQYLYCNSNKPHQLVGLYPVSSGASCSNYTSKTADYATGYDAWGNASSRNTGGSSASLTFDALDHLVAWNAGSTSQAWYAYDASGNRVLSRNIIGSGTSLTTYAFGVEEHIYSATGTNTGNTYYYSLGGHLIGELTGTSSMVTQFFLTDALGSVLASFSDTPNSATVLGNQVYGPYGNQRYLKGTIGTAKGYTGQYADPTGLDYYNARYYDPVAGVFLSVDMVQGNPQGMNPYAYVSGNPETYCDPTGNFRAPASYAGSSLSLSDEEAYLYRWGTNGSIASSGLPALLHMYLYDHSSWVEAESYAQYHLHSTTTILLGEEAFMLVRHSRINWNATNGLRHLYLQLMGLSLKVTQMIAGFGVEGSPLASLDELERMVAESVRELAGDTRLTVDNNGQARGEQCSFVATTLVATDHGEQPIGKLHLGDKVWAYNPKTHRMELEPILHVWINHDNDLVDLTLTSTKTDAHGKHSSTSEVLHTNQKHPFLTKEKGFLPVGQIMLGMHILEADGQYGVVTGWKMVPGTSVMYNLEVAQDHTYTVGIGQWVVHNATCPVKNLKPVHSPETSGRRPHLEKLSDQELLDSVNNNPTDPIRINPKTGKVLEGNGRAYELLRRAALPGSSITPDTPIYYEPYIPSSIPEPWEEPPDLWDLLT